MRRLSNLVWQADFDIYGKVKNLEGSKLFIPFRQMGQYEDGELDGLYYNRFRYYDSESGGYISQDPIGLVGHNPNLYAYTYNSNIQLDIFGLDLKPENGYLRGKRHGIGLSNKDAQIIANKDGLSHGKWGNKNDLSLAGKLSDQLEPGGFHDFPVSDTKSTVFHAGGDINDPLGHEATHFRLRNNGDGTFHGFPIDGTAEPIKGDPAKFKICP